MAKVAFCIMCVLTVFISCDDDDDDNHRHHHDSNSASLSEWQQRQEANKVCFSSEGTKAVSSESERL